MFRSGPENFAFNGLEDIGREILAEPRPGWRVIRPSLRKLRKPGSADSSGVWWAAAGVGALVYAAASALACITKKRTML
jgi:hypothetical protein